MKRRHLLQLTFGLTSIFLLVTCQSEMPLNVPTSTVGAVAGTAISQSLSESITPSPLPSVTSTVKVEATSTLIPDPLPSATAVLVTATPLLPSATPTIVDITPTPLPTLEGEELELAVAELLANPMNCDVPCWWGAKPGVTSVNDIKHIISPYNFDIYEYEYEDKGKLFTAMRLGIGHDEERNDFSIRVGFIFFNSILFDVSAYSPPISEVLAKYGQPDEIWLETVAEEYQGSLPVRLNMVYLEMGMAVGYVVDGDHHDDVVTGCFGDEEMGRLRLITPNTAISYNDFPIIFEADRRYLLLEEATSMTMDEFMQAFSDPTNPQCIETPAELWE